MMYRRCIEEPRLPFAAEGPPPLAAGEIDHQVRSVALAAKSNHRPEAARRLEPDLKGYFIFCKQQFLDRIAVNFLRGISQKSFYIGARKNNIQLERFRGFE